jgi:hypothetical protein
LYLAVPRRFCWKKAEALASLLSAVCAVEPVEGSDDLGLTSMPAGLDLGPVDRQLWTVGDVFEVRSNGAPRSLPWVAPEQHQTQETSP